MRLILVLLITFIDKTILAYLYATSAFLIVRVLFKAAKSRSAIFLNNANFVVLFALIINLIWTVLRAIHCKAEQVETIRKMGVEGYSFYYTSNCFTPLIWTLILAFLFQVIFLYRRFRTKPILTIISVALLLIHQNLEKLVIAITGLYRDFLPSGWGVYYSFSDRVWTILFSVVFFGICWTIPFFANTKKHT